MASMLDKSLDEIIKDRSATQKKTKGAGGKGATKAGGKGAAKAGRGGAASARGKAVPARGGRGLNATRGKTIAKPVRAKPYVQKQAQNLRMAIDNDQWAHDKYQQAAPQARFNAAASVESLETGTKLLISNLDFNVSDEDIKELFEELGDVKRSSVHFDRAGRSKGSAEVVYSRKVDAINAMNRYNGVRLDGKAMQIEIASSGVIQAGPSFVAKPQAAGGARTVTVNVRGGGRGGYGGGRMTYTRGRGGGRGGGGRGGGRGAAYKAMES